MGLMGDAAKQGLQLSEDFATLPPGGQRGGLCRGFSSQTLPSQGKGTEAHCPRRLKQTGQGEPRESSHRRPLPLHTCLCAPQVFQACPVLSILPSPPWSRPPAALAWSLPQPPHHLQSPAPSGASASVPQISISACK